MFSLFSMTPAGWLKIYCNRMQKSFFSLFFKFSSSMENTKNMSNQQPNQPKTSKFASDLINYFVKIPMNWVFFCAARWKSQFYECNVVYISHICESIYESSTIYDGYSIFHFDIWNDTYFASISPFAFNTNLIIFSRMCQACINLRIFIHQESLLFHIYQPKSK